MAEGNQTSLNMVTKKTIDSIYKQYNRPPASTDELNIGLLFDYAMENHGIVIDENDHEILEFENYIAIVLANSIVFLNKNNSDVNVHIRMESPSVWSRLKSTLVG